MRNLIAALCFLAPAAALAGGYVVPNVNARDLAMAGAAQAAQDSAAATYALPAALSRIDGFNFSLDASLVDLRSTWNDSYGLLGGASQTSIAKGAFPPALYVAY